jgi:ammonia channel protein AmtB
MPAEPFIIFFLLQSVRRILRTTDPFNKWRPTLLYLLYGTVALFIIDLVLHQQAIVQWIWHGLLIGLICIALIKKEFAPFRTLIYAVLPFAILSFASDLFGAISLKQFKKIDDYLDVAVIFSIVWMVAMIFVSRKQQRALQREHEKTQQE